MEERSSDELIRTEDLCKVYRMGAEEVRAVWHVSMVVHRGEFVCLMGPSGSGKSTLMHLLGCLDTPTSGMYWLAGQDVSKLSPNAQAEIRNRRIGFVFQAFNLLPNSSAIENVELPLLYGPWDRKRERALKALELVGLSERAHHRPTELSGGQQQRVAIARAIVTEPDIVMADEPTGNLDTRAGQQVMQVFTELNRGGTTIIVVTHDPNVASFAERVLHLRDGQIVRETTGKDAARVHNGLGGGGGAQ
ncbi:MAG: ABC transporter ATP-binding protein [Armatimonadetes bacterium]|nr:ABC transporter ATP-binding protein [Armatimonadota bacterium]